jgi:Zn-dependent M28 family amino/carboxypeptidase
MLRKLAMLTLAITFAAPSTLPRQSLLEHITAAGIHAHMAFLADDLLEGRGTGTRGYALAANYVRAQFEQLGLAPAGDNGTYFQNVKLRQVQTIGARDGITVSRGGQATALTFEKDFLMFGDAARAYTEISGAAIFAGYGITAPDQHYDDFAGIDAKGKIIVVFSGGPPTFPSSERAYYSDTPNKFRNAAAHGAAGVIEIWSGPQTKNTPFAAIVSYSHQPIMYWLDKDGTPNDYVPAIRGQALLTEEAGTALFTGAPHTFADAYASVAAGKPMSFALPEGIQIREAAKYTALESPNIAATLPGSDPVLKDQYVLITAHVDHVGIGDAVDGDTIYNGAVDNASGAAALIEIARAFASATGAERPMRSVMFLAVTGEEAGLLGSDYFAHYPTVPISQIAANVNMDGISLFYEFKDIIALGAEHSTIAEPVSDVARHFNLEVSPDPMPEEGFFIRSDQYSFVKQGVPAVNISEGWKTVDPSIDGRKMQEDYIRNRYHTPQDDMSQPLNFKAAVLDTQVNFAVAYEIANAPARPTWNRNDIFGDRFAKK